MAGLFILQFFSSCMKRCKDQIRLPFLPQMHGYFSAYQPGSWWTYVSLSGAHDSVYVSDQQKGYLAIDETVRPCYLMPTATFKLNSYSMDSLGYLNAHYAVGSDGKVSLFAITGRHNRRMTLTYETDVDGFSSNENLNLLADTVIGAFEIQNALVIQRTNSEPRQIRSFILAEGLGIAAYITATDTFNLTNYWIP